MRPYSPIATSSPLTARIHARASDGRSFNVIKRYGNARAEDAPFCISHDIVSPFRHKGHQGARAELASKTVVAETKRGGV